VLLQYPRESTNRLGALNVNLVKGSDRVDSTNRLGALNVNLVKGSDGAYSTNQPPKRKSKQENGQMKSQSRRTMEDNLS